MKRVWKIDEENSDMKHRRYSVYYVEDGRELDACNVSEWTRNHEVEYQLGLVFDEYDEMFCEERDLHDPDYCDDLRTYHSLSLWATA